MTPKALIYLIEGRPPEAGEAIDQLAMLSEVARKEGVLPSRGTAATSGR